MPSTDISGEPILILSLVEAEQIQILMLATMTVKGHLFNKVTRFLEEAKEHVQRTASEQERTDLSP
jgi:hypothetical protein